MNRLPGEPDGGQANNWGHSVSKTQFLVFLNYKYFYYILDF